MGFSETLKRNTALVGVIVALLVIAAVVSVVWESKPLPPPPQPLTGQSFYSVDDGKSFFLDSAQKIPPFDHAGQTAVRAYVFSCDGGKTRFVGYLERYTPEGRQHIEDLMAKRETSPMSLLAGATTSGAEVKKPGDADWIAKGDIEKASAVLDVKCPHEGQHPCEPVLP